MDLYFKSHGFWTIAWLILWCFCCIFIHFLFCCSCCTIESSDIFVCVFSEILSFKLWIKHFIAQLCFCKRNALYKEYFLSICPWSCFFRPFIQCLKCEQWYQFTRYRTMFLCCVFIEQLFKYVWGQLRCKRRINCNLCICILF